MTVWLMIFPEETKFLPDSIFRAFSSDTREAFTWKANLWMSSLSANENGVKQNTKKEFVVVTITDTCIQPTTLNVVKSRQTSYPSSTPGAAASL